MLPSYMRWMSRSISNGSCPMTHSARPRQILCDSGASIMALATSEEESTSPTPTIPASVWTLTTSVSWLPSQRSLTLGKRRWIGSTRVIFMRVCSISLSRIILFPRSYANQGARSTIRLASGSARFLCPEANNQAAGLKPAWGCPIQETQFPGKCQYGFDKVNFQFQV